MLDTKPTPIHINGQPESDKRVVAVYRCRLKIDELGATDHPDVKFCDYCQQKVFKVDDFDGIQKAIASKGCVWGPREIRPGIPERSSMFLGAPVLDYYDSSRSLLKWED